MATVLDTEAQESLGKGSRRRTAARAAADHRQQRADRAVVYGETLNGFDPDADLGYPGQYPFTRGVHAAMYRSRLWTMRQFAGFGTPRQTNERFRFLLAKGQTGLSTAFDLPTLMGLDSDDPRSWRGRPAWRRRRYSRRHA